MGFEYVERFFAAVGCLAWKSKMGEYDIITPRTEASSSTINTRRVTERAKEVGSVASVILRLLPRGNASRSVLSCSAEHTLYGGI